MYRRSTADADLSALPADARTALHNYASAHRLELDVTMPAWVTRSENLPSRSWIGRLLGRRANPADPDDEHQTLVILHPTHLIVEVSGAERGITAMSVPLASASIADAPPNSGDRGFTVGGWDSSDGAAGTFFIGLGPEDAGTRCAEAVRAAVASAKND